MQLDDPLICAPAIEEAIDFHPQRVAPDTPLMDAIAQMNQIQGCSCSLSSSESSSDQILNGGERSSCILVMNEAKLLGIVTERDIVSLTAKGVNLEAMTVSQAMTHPVVSLPKSAFADIFAALFLFRRYRIRHLPILDEQGQLVGIVSPEQIRRVLRPANLLKLRRVSDVMTSDVIQASLTLPVFNLAQLMAEHRVSCVVITQPDSDERNLPVGIVTERDIVQFQSLQLNLARTPAQDVMSTPLFLLNPQDSLWTAHQEMQKRRVRRLVVSWNWGRNLGLVTQTSLLRVFDPTEMYGIVETLQQTVQQLEAEKAENLEQLLSISTVPTQPNPAKISDQQVSSLLSQIQAAIEHLIADPNPSQNLQQRQLNSVLGDVQQVRELMQKHNEISS